MNKSLCVLTGKALLLKVLAEDLCCNISGRMCGGLI